MENSTVSGLRSRSRSKTPFLRSSCDRESCPEGEGHSHKAGRRTPSKRSTPVKQLQATSTGKATPEPIIEVDEEPAAPALRTRKSARVAAEKLIKTSDYSSEDSPDRLRSSVKESAHITSYKYEYSHVSTSAREAGARRGAAGAHASLADVTLSPIQGSYNASGHRSFRVGSPAYSSCSTDSSFAEQALADASALGAAEHLPSRLYRSAGEYWNKYPKTDYTYSPLSRDRVELAPGQVAVPNMSRRSLSQFRVQGPLTSQDELDDMRSSLRKRYTSIESSDDEAAYSHFKYTPLPQRWWITTLLISMVTTVTSSLRSVYSAVAGAGHRGYQYRDHRQQRSALSRAGSALAAPLVWVYSLVRTAVTTTVTTVTETLSPSKQAGAHRGAARRRWPWLLLLLLPLVGYGCYRCEDLQQLLPQQRTDVPTFTPPTHAQDPDLSKRLKALEDWAVSVNAKLSQLDTVEARIEQYSLKHMRNNLVQIFNMDANAEALAAKLQSFFDERYMSKQDQESFSQQIHRTVVESLKPGMDEEAVRKVIREYLETYERRQLEVIVRTVQEHVGAGGGGGGGGGAGGEVDLEAVRRIVSGMLDVYDADKTGLVDYAMESAGGQVLSTRCTELYDIKTKQYSVLGLAVYWAGTSPRHALAPGAAPGDCWAFQGFPGYLVVRTYAIIEVTGFSVEHMPRLLAPDGKIESAPKNFTVYGLRDELDSEPHLFGSYMYDAASTPIQYFPVQHPKTESIAGRDYPVAYDIVELRVESNHGNPTYTCLYRFRVHGNPLSDIRQATEDNMRDS